MNRLSNRTLPVVLALAFGSLGAVACAAPAEAPSAPAASEVVPSGDVAGDSVAEALAGESGFKSSGNPTTAFVGKTLAGSAAKKAAVLEVEVPGSPDKERYDVYAFDFGIDGAAAPISSGTGGAGGGKASLRPLTIVVKPQANAGSLRKAVLLGTAFPKIVLSRPSADGKAPPAPLATFETAFVGVLGTNAGNGSALESYVVHAGAVTLTHDKANVKIDRLTNTTSCQAPCPCVLDGGAGMLGAYVQADAGVAIDAKSTRVDFISVALHNEVSIGSGTTGAGAGKAVLDGIELGREVETSGVCAAYYAALGAHVPTLEIGVGVSAPIGAKPAPRESISWDACHAFVKQVSFASGGDAPSESISFGAAGLVRTDRTFEPKLTESTYGWSFATNKSIAACSAVFE
jgi:hypothetical protein